MSLSVLLAAAVLGAGLSWALVGLVRDLARRRGLLDVPNARSSHARPTPRLGGLGIIGAVLAAVGLGAAMGMDTSTLLPLLAPAAAVGGLSLIDDLRGVPALVRLGFHVAAAVGVLWAIGALDHLVVRADDLAPGATLIGLSDIRWAALSLVWIVGFVNAFNFMDGIDGIAGVQAAIAGTAWLIIGALLDEPALALLGAVVAAACFGFLRHNWSPASIFMGDVGSAFLGLILATAPLAVRPGRGLLIPAILTVWPFVFDTALTLVRRATRGENLMEAHRSHLYQRLTQAGWSHARVAALYGALAAGGALLAVAVAIELITATAALAVAALAGCALWSVVLRVERLPGRGAMGGLQDSSRA